ncbi:MAG: hypothetical protein K0R94_1034 [Burkholderiales bacterium]|jgi:chorismate-pyruvate lyase|nr:hypothetical protein [Burkholderiales bacterium]
MNWENIVYDPGSTTKSFKYLTNNYKLEILFSGLCKDTFKRIIVINLDDIPVMLASSETLISNKLFLDILQNASTTPIGVKLFSPKSGIKRGNMSVTQVEVATIKDPIVTNFMQKSGFSDKLYFRISEFTYKTQVMELKEYILPGLKLVVDKYNEEL